MNFIQSVQDLDGTGVKLRVGMGHGVIAKKICVVFWYELSVVFFWATNKNHPEKVFCNGHMANVPCDVGDAHRHFEPFFLRHPLNHLKRKHSGPFELKKDSLFIKHSNFLSSARLTAGGHPLRK